MLKRKSKLFLILFICLLLITGCTSKDEESLTFKKEFESLNDKLFKVNISEKNHFKISSAEEVLSMFSNNESFVILFGNSSDYYTRTIIESLDESASKLGLSKIYYVDIKAINDEYSIDVNNVITKTKDAGNGYYDLVNYLSEYLKDYTVINKDNKEVSVGVKKITMPLVVGIIKSKVSSIITGVSKLQTTDMETLTDEIKEDQKKIMHDTINEVVIDLSTCDINNNGC